jgi:hypothetical protein
MGALFGLGALGGEAVKSFFKRRKWDRAGGAMDSGGSARLCHRRATGYRCVRASTITEVAAILAFSFGADIAVNHTAFKIGIRD